MGKTPWGLARLQTMNDTLQAMWQGFNYALMILTPVWVLLLLGCARKLHPRYRFALLVLIIGSLGVFATVYVEHLKRVAGP